MSNLAIGVALGAGMNNRSGSSDNKTIYCNQVMPVFNPKTATVEQKQDYAKCVNHFYPIMTPVDIIVFKVIIVISFISYIIGTWMWFKTDGVVVFAISLIIPILISLVLFSTYICFSFVFFGG